MVTICSPIPFSMHMQQRNFQIQWPQFSHEIYITTFTLGGNNPDTMDIPFETYFFEFEGGDEQTNIQQNDNAGCRKVNEKIPVTW